MAFIMQSSYNLVCLIDWLRVAPSPEPPGMPTSDCYSEWSTHTKDLAGIHWRIFPDSYFISSKAGLFKEKKSLWVSSKYYTVLTDHAEASTFMSEVINN